nr:tyrosine-type recombinase/integrase [Solibacillus kalamii]
MIDKLDTRAKAITLFNLITACRPSEMVAIQVKHIDLKNRSVNVYLKKQKEWHTKRLTLEVVNVLKEYIASNRLDSESYLVGKVDKHNNYTSVQVSDIAYRKSIHKWLGFAPYTLRKTQVSAMHEAGADLATIAKQSGHKNLETINKHYLSVNDKTIDKYL